MSRLRDLAGGIRSSNAGASRMTFDIMFDDPNLFRIVQASNVITPSLIASAYGVSETDVRIYAFKPALTIKITIPRYVMAGNPEDTDIDGKQQHVPLLDIEVPSI